jgi:hypothetical protein
VWFCTAPFLFGVISNQFNQAVAVSENYTFDKSQGFCLAEQSEAHITLFSVTILVFRFAQSDTTE